MNEKKSLHDLYERYYGKRKVETRGVKRGSKRGKYESHMKKQSVGQKRKKNRLRQQKYQQRQRKLAEQVNYNGFLKTGGILSPNSKDNVHISQQQHSQPPETEAAHGILLITKNERR